MNTEKFEVSIPFPVWDGIAQINAAISSLHKEPMLSQLRLGTPRRILGASCPAPDYNGAEYGMKIRLWVPGCYVTAVIAGTEDTAYGTLWILYSVDFRFDVKEEGRGTLGRFNVSLNRFEIEELRSEQSYTFHVGYFEKRLLKEDEEARKSTQRLLDGWRMGLASRTAQADLIREMKSAEIRKVVNR